MMLHAVELKGKSTDRNKSLNEKTLCFVFRPCPIPKCCRVHRAKTLLMYDVYEKKNQLKQPTIV